MPADQCGCSIGESFVPVGWFTIKAMGKKPTIEVSDEVHAQPVAIQDQKKAEVKAKVPLAIIAAEVLAATLVKPGRKKTAG